MLIDLLESSKVIGLCPNQEEILKQVLNGRDILFCSPTGSGKSLIFEVAPFAFHFLGQMKSFSFGCFNEIEGSITKT